MPHYMYLSFLPIPDVLKHGNLSDWVKALGDLNDYIATGSLDMEKTFHGGELKSRLLVELYSPIADFLTTLPQSHLDGIYDELGAGNADGTPEKERWTTLLVALRRKLGQPHFINCLPPSTIDRQ